MDLFMIANLMWEKSDANNAKRPATINLINALHVFRKPRIIFLEHCYFAIN